MTTSGHLLLLLLLQCPAKETCSHSRKPATATVLHPNGPMIIIYNNKIDEKTY
jgi:hypothetical protein